MANSVSTRSTLALPAPSAILELLKPITWFAPMWAFGCGVVSSGVSILDHLDEERRKHEEPAKES